jgi:hypothetical protein
VPSPLRRKPGKLLKAKRRQVSHESKAAAKQLTTALHTTTPGAVDISHHLSALQRSLRSLRTSVLHHSTGPNRALVASALHDLDLSLSKLAQAAATSDPTAAMNTLAQGKHLLDKARKDAHKAGHDWQL